MIQSSSFAAYAEIEQRLPECCRDVYRTIYENPDLCIAEIGERLRMQNSTVSGRVNDLIESRLVSYAVNSLGQLEHKTSPISGMKVQKLRANSVFDVKPELIKSRKTSGEKSVGCGDGRGSVTPDKFQNQGKLFSNDSEFNAA